MPVRKDVHSSASEMGVQENENAPHDALPTLNPRNKTVASSLVRMGAIEEEDIEAIREYQHKHGISFENAAIRLHKVNSRQLEQAKARYYHYPVLSKEDRKRYSKELITAWSPDSKQAESIRSLRSRILLESRNAQGSGPQQCSFAVVSPDSGDGRSYLAANLAIAFGQLGRATALLDLDMRKPRQHAIFNITNQIGISDVFAENSNRHNWEQLSFISNLVVIPAGPIPPNPQELLSQPTLNLILDSLYKIFEFVIIDSPPADRYADADIITSRVKSAIVVTRRHHTRIKALDSFIGRMKSNQVKILGTVYNEI